MNNHDKSPHFQKKFDRETSQAIADSNVTGAYS